MNYQQILQDIYEEIKPHADEGKQSDYIPALAQVNPDQFGIFLQLLSGETYTLGAYDQKFSIQSISKVFSLAIALSILGKSLWQRIGKEPSSNFSSTLCVNSLATNTSTTPLMWPAPNKVAAT